MMRTLRKVSNEPAPSCQSGSPIRRLFVHFAAPPSQDALIFQFPRRRRGIRSVDTCQASSVVRIGPRAGMIAARLSGLVRMAHKVIRPAGSRVGFGGPHPDQPETGPSPMPSS